VGAIRRVAVLALALAGLAAAAPAAYGAGAMVEIDGVPGQIYDVDATRTLFRQSDDAFAVKDRATGAVTPILVGADQDPSGGFLTSHGELLLTRTTTSPYGHLDEIRDGSPVDLGDVPVGATLRVAGDYATWSNSSGVIRRNLSDGTQVTVSADGGAADVASTGEVVYVDSGHNVHRYRSLLDDTVVGPADSGHSEINPLTDGTNVLWSDHPTPCCGPDVLRAYGPTGAFSPGALDGGDGLGRGNDYAAAGGWIAFTRGRMVPLDHCCEIELKTVWVRSPAGVETQVSDEAQYGIRGLAPDGEVLYSDPPLDHFFLGRPGEEPVEIAAADFDPGSVFDFARGYGDFAFKSSGSWYAALNGSLRRISLDEAAHDGSRTQITAGPEGVDNPSHATFSFASAGHEEAAFECKLDDGDYEACEPPATFTSLQHGQHTLAVRSVVPGEGADPDPAVAAWVVESDPPAPTITAPADEAFTNDSTPQLAGTAGDDDGDDATVTAKIYGHDNPNSPLRTVEATRSGGAWSVDVTPPLDDATYTVHVEQGDDAGNSGSSATRTFSIDATPPPAIFVTEPNLVLTGHAVTLHADTGDFSGVKRFQWDLDGDGDFERDTGATPQVTTTYDEPGRKLPGVRTTDGTGNTNAGHWGFTVYPDPPPGLVGVTIDDGDQFTNDPNVFVSPVWPAGAANVILSNDGGFRNAVSSRLRSSVPWRLDSSGPERLPKTIYARFDPNGATYQDDIILDETPPALLEAEITKVDPRVSAAAARKRIYHLHVKARDRTAGVSRMQITTNRRHPGKKRRYRSHVDFRSTTSKIFVRVRDRAGNWSRWKRCEK
jgi:Bacterial Ig-like domain